MSSDIHLISALCNYIVCLYVQINKPTPSFFLGFTGTSSKLWFIHWIEVSQAFSPSPFSLRFWRC